MTLSTIAKHTNQNAHQQIAGNVGRTDIKRQRPWEDVTAADIGGYIGATLLLGAQPGSRNMAYYWDTDNSHPDFPISRYISRDRYKQITQYLKINSPNEELNAENWWHKVEPLATQFRVATRPEIYQPGQNLAIDEQLVQFTGRSKDTIQMDSKVAGEGYKIYSLCDPHGYMLNFKFSSARTKIAEIRPYPGYSNGETVVLRLTEELLVRFPPPTSPYYTLHIDNFFTRVRLYEELYKKGIGANGTCKAGSGISRELALFRDCTSKEKNYGLWRNQVQNNVNCIAFVDMRGCTMMTTVHDPTVEDLHWFPYVQRPGVDFNSAVQRGFGRVEDGVQQLSKLQAVHDYNLHMGGADLHAQLNSSYSTSEHWHRRTWWPLFYMLIDAAITNSYVLCKQAGLQIAHVELQELVAYALLENPACILRNRVQISTNACQSFFEPHTLKRDFFGHKWEKFPDGTRKRCVVCAQNRRRTPLEEISGNSTSKQDCKRDTVIRTVYFCTKCVTALCFNSHCWQRHLELHGVPYLASSTPP